MLVILLSAFVNLIILLYVYKNRSTKDSTYSNYIEYDINDANLSNSPKNFYSANLSNLPKSFYDANLANSPINKEV